MGRRKRKQASYRPARIPPKIFDCPRCGKKTMKAPVSRSKSHVLVQCGHCGLQETVERNTLTEPVDAFGSFIDIYYKDREFDRLSQRLQDLFDKQQYTEATLVYSFLTDIAKINAEKTLEVYGKTKDPQELEKAELWQQSADEFTKERDKLNHELETGMIEDAIIEENVYSSDEVSPIDEEEREKVPDKPKKRTNIEDILGDTGFLEF